MGYWGKTTIPHLSQAESCLRVEKKGCLVGREEASQTTRIANIRMQDLKKYNNVLKIITIC